MTVFDWLGRVIMLVLAGMITLSIIGAIAAIPSGGLPERIGMVDREAPVPPDAQPSPAPAPAPRAAEETKGEGTGPGDDRASMASAAGQPVDPAEWLEAITYALLALVGIAAFATILLWRMLHQRRRIADALEAISAALPPSMPSPQSRTSASG